MRLEFLGVRIETVWNKLPPDNLSGQERADWVVRAQPRRRVQITVIPRVNFDHVRVHRHAGEMLGDTGSTGASREAILGEFVAEIDARIAKGELTEQEARARWPRYDELRQ